MESTSQVAAVVRVATHGKAFVLDGSPFRFRGVRYRQAPGSAGPSSAERDRIRRDLADITTAGYTLVSMPPPPVSDIDLAVASGLRVLLDLGELYPNHTVPTSRRERVRSVRELAMAIRRTVRQWDGSDALLGVALTQPTPPGRSRAELQAARRAADELAIALRDEDPGLPAAWRAGWPVARECPAEFDFLIIDCDLSGWDELPTALMSCHCEVGDRPLVLGSVSVAGIEQGHGPDMIDVALRSGVGGTIAPRSPAPGSAIGESELAGINHRTVRDLERDWPSISIVITAYNAEATLAQCLSHCARLEYPELEVIVVDDGSTDATPAVARAHRGVQLVTIRHRGLAVGRNVGYRSARGDLIAYLDADAYPTPDWPWYLALAALDDRAGGSGGPNVPPANAAAGARVVARSPGGPVPELLTPDRARHLPGCNVAFWRRVLEQLGGFDPVFDGTADDVEFEWRVAESGHELAYHPSALVWHHRRPGLRPYLRQQRQYGRGQAILERHNPDRFPTGHRLRKAATRLRTHGPQPGSTGACGVRYLTLPSPEHAALEFAHQWGMPAAALLSLTAPLALVRRRLAAPAGAAAAAVAALFAVDLLLAGEGQRRSERTFALRCRQATFRLLRPLAFRWGHLSGRRELRQ